MKGHFKTGWRVLLIFLALALFTAPFDNGSPSAHAQGHEGYPKLSYGSHGDYVWDLQYRLKTLNLYTHPLDGYFGDFTLQAVKTYQRSYGLPPDGVVGKETWLSLTRFTMNIYEVDQMARLVYGEARGEPFEGQVAVAAVVINRVQSAQFPDRVADVIFEPLAFTAVADGQFYLTPDSEAYRAVFEAIKGWDPTGEALYYYNPQTATSPWIWTRTPMKRIGNHVFAL